MKPREMTDGERELWNEAQVDALPCLRCLDTFELADGSTCPDCCPHEEHDHGICLECKKDIHDDLVGRAEYLEDR